LIVRDESNILFVKGELAMKTTLLRSLAALGFGTVAVLGASSVAGAQDGPGWGPIGGPGGQFAGGHAIYVQTDNPSGNVIDVFSEHPDGRLSLRLAVPTGGLGGQAAGSVVDHLASQGSLVYDSNQQLLFAVNAGSNTVSLFAAHGREVKLLQVVSSGGVFPDSVAVHGNLVYVLNAGGTGSVAGFKLFGNHLVALPGSTRSLGLTNTTPPFFLTAPGQVGFSPNGSELIVTTKGSTNSLDTFGISPSGQLSAEPVATPDTGNVPFSFVTSPAGQLVVAEAGASAIQTFGFTPNGALTSLSTSVTDGQKALCWITTAGEYYYVANAGSNSVSAYVVSFNGTPTLVGSTSEGVASTDTGPIDLTASANGKFLYVEAGGAGAVDEFQVNPGGSLSDLGSVAGLGAGIEGIAAS
jgi:6-phosphogluconolactonase (cycloisomerase 2 family)